MQGCHYAFKVAALHFLTVMQGLAKASLFWTIQDTHGSEALRASTSVWCLPALIPLIPNYVLSRHGAALLEAVLDVGDMVPSIWLCVVFATAESLTAFFWNSFPPRTLFARTETYVRLWQQTSAKPKALLDGREVCASKMSMV